MYHKFLFCVSLLTSISFNVYAQNTTTKQTSQEWGDISEGLQLSIRAEKELLSVCEPLVLYISLKNVTEHTRKINYRGFWADFRIIIINENSGKEIPLPTANEPEPIRERRKTHLNFQIQLDSGQLYHYPHTRSERIPYLTTPGTYLIALERNIFKLNWKELLEKDENIIAKLKSNFIKVTVTEESSEEGECYNKLIMFGPNK